MWFLQIVFLTTICFVSLPKFDISSCSTFPLYDSVLLGVACWKKCNIAYAAGASHVRLDKTSRVEEAGGCLYKAGQQGSGLLAHDNMVER